MNSNITRRSLIKTLSSLAVGGTSGQWITNAMADEIMSLFRDQFTDFPYRAQILDNDEIVDIDNDEIGELISEGKAKILDNYRPMATRSNQFLPLERVLSSISPEVEQYFDYFICINTAQKDVSPTNFVPAQSMTIIGRSATGQKIFERGAHSNEVIGISSTAQKFQSDFFETHLNSAIQQSSEYARRQGIDFQFQRDSQLPYLLPISSGLAASGSILTFSGAFQINWNKTLDHQQSSVNAPMSHAMYIYHRYGRAGRWSGVAVHGTPPSNWNKLGKTRASHGCVRTLPFVAKVLRGAFVSSSSRLATSLPEFDSISVLPKLTGRTISASRPKVIMVIFQGYERPNIYLG